MIIPSIDLMNKKVVQLQQGKKKMVELNNPLNFAKRFSRFSEIQIIDLDAALNKGENLKIVKKICKISRCRVGGGIRSIEKAKKLMESGAEKIIIGTKANRKFLSELCRIIGKDRIIVALDARKNKIAVKGWKKQTNKEVVKTAKTLQDYCSEFLYTCIDKEGLMQGPDFETINKLKKVTNNKICVAGGISTIEEIKKFDDIGIDSVVGMAIYTGKINPEEAFIETLNWEKMKGLIPTIIKDEQGNVLMLAYSSKESLKKTLETGNCWYFSRSRNKLWMKGETSGNTQELLNTKTDCDKDALLFIVKQKGNACHLNRYSCFKEKKAFNLNQLYNIISEKIKNKDENSYSYQISQDIERLKRKIIEEAGEVVTAKNKKELILEISDLLYFLLVSMAKNDITLEEIDKENEKRNKETLLNKEKLNKLNIKEARRKKWQ